jgi:periplasmic protein TonB
MFTGKRGLALLVVILLHVIVGYAFYSGLASRLAQTIIPPVEIAQIDKPKDVDKPPPPPPKLEEIKPYVPPPEFVDIQAPQEQTNAIAVVTQQVQAAPAPVVAAPPPAPKASTSIGQDPKHPLKIGDDYYPDASRRANEEGRCVVSITVSVDGRITNEAIQTSSGFPRLDEACLKGVHGQRMRPATEDGKPVEKTQSLPIVWKLTK